MKYTEAKYGRIFALRLEDGEILHEVVEDFAAKQGVASAAVIAVGGVDQDSTLIVGPEQGRTFPVTPMDLVLDNVHEVMGTGTLFQDEEGVPILHMHLACGRDKSTRVGCVRSGVKVWQILEVVVFELIDCEAKRTLDEKTGFKLLNIQ